jgi:hypothetical protein
MLGPQFWDDHRQQECNRNETVIEKKYQQQRSPLHFQPAFEAEKIYHQTSALTKQEFGL